MRAELINLPGLTSIRYQADQDTFLIIYRQEKVKIADMVAAVWMAGKKEGQEFVAEIIG